MALDFELHLKEPRALFVFDPQSDYPFDPDALGDSGFEFLLARIIGFWWRAPRVRAVVWLPEEHCTPQVEGQLREAMYRWCDDLLVANRRERVEFLINNTLFMGIAVLVLAVSYVVQGGIEGPGGITDAGVRGAIIYGLDVLLWVALWAPISAFLLDWFPLFRLHQAYKALRHMELSVRPEP